MNSKMLSVAVVTLIKCHIILNLQVSMYVIRTTLLQVILNLILEYEQLKIHSCEINPFPISSDWIFEKDSFKKYHKCSTYSTLLTHQVSFFTNHSFVNNFFNRSLWRRNIIWKWLILSTLRTRVAFAESAWWTIVPIIDLTLIIIEYLVKFF